VGAFYDGEGMWRARFSCTAPGLWHWTAAIVDQGPADVGLSQHGRVLCGTVGNATAHGGLEVDSAYPHHFKWHDGTRYFPVR
jgi:hypothetical protein